LTGRFADVNANVVTVGRMPFLHQAVNLVQQFQYGGLLRRGHFEEIGDMPAWNDDGVSRRERVIVVARIRSAILGKHLRRRA